MTSGSVACTFSTSFLACSKNAGSPSLDLAPAVDGSAEQYVLVAAASATQSLPIFLEFAAPGVSKASGLALVADLLGFTAEEVVAVGDAENDREMLEWARWGLAVANADERLIGEADAVIPSVHEDGVAQLLEALAASSRDLLS